MKTKLTSLILACTLILACILSACSPSGDADSPVKTVEKTERRLYTNAFKTNYFETPDDYEVSSSAVVHGGRIYMLVRHPDEFIEANGEGTNLNSTVVSYNTDGTDMRSEEEITHRDVDHFAMLSDGSRVFIRSVYNDSTFEDEYQLEKTDAEGNTQFTVSVSAMIPKDAEVTASGRNSTINLVAVDAADRIYIQLIGCVIVVSPETGEKLFDVSLGEASMRKSINTIIRTGDKIAMLYYDNEEYFRYIDADRKEIGGDLYMPDEYDHGTNYIISAYGEHDPDISFYFRSPMGLFSVSTDGKVNEIVNWMNSDISPESMYDMKVLSGDLIYYRGFAPFSTKVVRVALTRIPDDVASNKTLIEVAYVSSFQDDSIYSAAIKFNQENDKYRVIFTDYKQLSGNLEGEELMSFINRDIAVGNIPDVFITGVEFTGKSYEDKGLYCDLYEYLDADSELTRDMFVKSALAAGDVKGELLYLPASFTVSTLVGKAENIGNAEGWSMAEFLDIAENLPDGVKMLAYETRKSVYDWVIRDGLSEFIDFDAGTCSFDGDLFIRLLDYIGTLPETTLSSKYGGIEWCEEYLANKALLKKSDIRTFIDYIKNQIDFGTEALTYAGFPSVGSKIKIGTSFAISAKSDENTRDGAWEFIKDMLLSKSTSFSVFSHKSFPSTYASFARFAGIERDGFYNVRPDGIRWGNREEGPEEGVPVIITQEDVDEILAYFETIPMSPYVFPKVYEIIDEEIQYFIAGAKPAAETAKLIHNRVSIYLSESQ